VVVFGCPAEEVSDLVAGGPVGEPVIDVGLPPSELFTELVESHASTA